MQHGAAKENKMDQQVKEAIERLAKSARQQVNVPLSVAQIVNNYAIAQSEKNKREANDAAREMLRATSSRRY
jgi:hypothetical protein